MKTISALVAAVALLLTAQNAYSSFGGCCPYNKDGTPDIDGLNNNGWAPYTVSLWPGPPSPCTPVTTNVIQPITITVYYCPMCASATGGAPAYYLWPLQCPTNIFMAPTNPAVIDLYSGSNSCAYFAESVWKTDCSTSLFGGWKTNAFQVTTWYSAWSAKSIWATNTAAGWTPCFTNVLLTQGPVTNINSLPHIGNSGFFRFHP